MLCCYSVGLYLAVALLVVSPHIKGALHQQLP